MAGPVKGAGRTARLALLTAVALTIFLAEAQLPVIPIPGVHGNTGYGIDMVKRSVEQAVGSDIIFNGN